LVGDSLMELDRLPVSMSSTPISGETT
jgi:hypothetical protein